MIDEIRYRINHFRYVAWNKFVFAFVWALPHEIVEIATVRVWANATCGPFGHVVPSDVTIDEALKHWRRREGGDKTYDTKDVNY